MSGNPPEPTAPPAPEATPPPAVRRPLLARPSHAAAVGIVVGAVLSALPTQIHWAETLSTSQAELGLPARLRLFTVSPTLLYSEHAGWSAHLHELLWLAVLSALLLGAATGVSRRSTDPEGRPFALCLALLAFAPLAHTAALVVLSLPRLLRDPVTRGPDMAQLLTDAQVAFPHMVLLGGCGVIAVACAVALHAGDSTGSSYPNRPASLGRALLRALAETTGPRPTLRRRIGGTLLASAGGLLVLLFLSSSRFTSLSAGPADALCHVSGYVEECSRRLVEVVSGPLPRNDEGRLPQAYWGYARLYALQGFTACFAVSYFFATAIPTVRRTSWSVFLAVWSAYTMGTVAYAVLLEFGKEAATGPLRRSDLPDLLTGLFIPPQGLAHALLGAPLAAGILAVLTSGRTRLRKAREAGRADEPGAAPEGTA